MDCYLIINNIGLVGDIIGVVLVFRYAVSPLVKEEDINLIVASAEAVQKLEKKQRKYTKRAKIGVGFMVIGFTLQIVSNLVK